MTAIATMTAEYYSTNLRFRIINLHLALNDAFHAIDEIEQFNDNNFPFKDPGGAEAAIEEIEAQLNVIEDVDNNYCFPEEIDHAQTALFMAMIPVIQPGVMTLLKLEKAPYVVRTPKAEVLSVPYYLGGRGHKEAWIEDTIKHFTPQDGDVLVCARKGKPMFAPEHDAVEYIKDLRRFATEAYEAVFGGKDA